MGDLAQDLIHHALEVLGGIFESEGASGELKKAKGSNDTSFSNILFPHGNLMETLQQVDLAEDGFAVQLSSKVT